MQEWHYAHGGQQHGPITAAELRALAARGQLLPTDLVWRQPMRDWAAASTVAGLFGLAPAPRMPSSVPAPAIGSLPRPAPAAAPKAGGADGFWSHVVEGGKIAPAIGGVFGLVADFLEPLGPINGYLFSATTATAIALSVWWWRLVPDQRRCWNKPLPHRALIFCLYLIGAFGLWLSLQRLNGAD